MIVRSEPSRRVLVIDDSAACRRLVEALLRVEAVEVSQAEDGVEGIDRACRLRPDLILLDIHLPGKDGFETIRKLKEDARTRAIPVIFISALSDPATKARGLDLGAVDFIAKPFDPIELRARVRAALRTKYLQDLLEERAHLDGLTGLGNRHSLDERLKSDWSVCRRRGTPLAILIADLDRFKDINDRHGHAVGDSILRSTGRLLRESVRDGDFVGRYGGEEFVVVAPDCGLGGAVAMAERFRLAVAGLGGAYRPAKIEITTSVGASAVELFDDEPDPLICRADSALYHAKAAGRDAVWACVRGEMRPAATVLELNEEAIGVVPTISF